MTAGTLPDRLLELVLAQEPTPAVSIVIEWLCPHGRSSWHWIGCQWTSATCVSGRREVRWIR